MKKIGDIKEDMNTIALKITTDTKIPITEGRSQTTVGGTTTEILTDLEVEINQEDILIQRNTNMERTRI